MVSMVREIDNNDKTTHYKMVISVATYDATKVIITFIEFKTAFF